MLTIDHIFFVNKTSLMQFVRYLLYPSQLYMFRMSLPSILRSTVCTGGKVQYMCTVIIYVKLMKKVN